LKKCNFSIKSFVEKIFMTLAANNNEEGGLQIFKHSGKQWSRVVGYSLGFSLSPFRGLNAVVELAF